MRSRNEPSCPVRGRHAESGQGGTVRWTPQQNEEVVSLCPAGRQGRRAACMKLEHGVQAWMEPVSSHMMSNPSSALLLYGPAQFYRGMAAEVGAMPQTDA